MTFASVAETYQNTMFRLMQTFLGGPASRLSRQNLSAVWPHHLQRGCVAAREPCGILPAARAFAGTGFAMSIARAASAVACTKVT